VKLVRLALALLLVASSASILGQESMPASRVTEKWNDMRASDLIGSTAVDRHGEILGTVEDLIVASDGGEAHYAVLSFAGMPELSDKLYTYPVSALAPGRASGEVTVEIDRKDLAAGKDRPVALWLRQYDPNAFIQERRFIYASELLGKAVDDRHRRPAGEVEDLVLNLGSGRLRYVIAEIGDQPYALPHEALTIPSAGKAHLVLKVDRAQLK
jgi:sporulation protein YlmC with PRC-barrel domain